MDRPGVIAPEVGEIVLIRMQFTQGRVVATNWTPFEVERVGGTSFSVRFLDELHEIAVDDWGTVWHRAH